MNSMDLLNYASSTTNITLVKTVDQLNQCLEKSQPKVAHHDSIFKDEEAIPQVKKPVTVERPKSTRGTAPPLATKIVKKPDQ